MRRKAIVRSTFALLLLGGAGFVVGDARGGQTAPDELRGQLAVFGDWFQRSMDLECSGRVPTVRLVEIMNPGRDRPRQMNWVMALDFDADGFVEPGEVGAGMWRSLQHQVERRMHGDVDGDGALSPREYALFVPDPGAETNEERVSELQAARFASFDHNEDRRVTRLEILDEFVRNYIARHWGRLVLFHLGRADADGDGAVDGAELTGAIEAAGVAPDPDALDLWFETMAGKAGDTSVPRLVLAEIPAALIEAGATAEGRARIEGLLAPLLAPACAAP